MGPSEASSLVLCCSVYLSPVLHDFFKTFVCFFLLQMMIHSTRQKSPTPLSETGASLLSWELGHCEASESPRSLISRRSAALCPCTFLKVATKVLPATALRSTLKPRVLYWWYLPFDLGPEVTSILRLFCLKRLRIRNSFIFDFY